MKQTATTYKVGGRKQTKAQKMQKSRATKATKAKSSLTSITDTTSKGVGKYAKRSGADIGSRRAYKLEKQALKNEKFGLESKPAIIKAAGQAVAMNTAPASTTYAATAGYNTRRSNDTQGQISDLISGGAQQTNTSNEEDIAGDVLPGGFLPR